MYSREATKKGLQLIIEPSQFQILCNMPKSTPWRLPQYCQADTWLYNWFVTPLPYYCNYLPSALTLITAAVLHRTCSEPLLHLSLSSKVQWFEFPTGDPGTTYGDYASAWLYRGSSKLLRLYPDEVRQGQGSSSGIFRCYAGDRVFVECARDGSKLYVDPDSPGPHSTFTGMMLRRGHWGFMLTLSMPLVEICTQSLC